MDDVLRQALVLSDPDAFFKPQTAKPTPPLAAEARRKDAAGR